MKVIYPFCNFPSRSKPGEIYIVNLRAPDEVRCTCGAWKYFRNKNNGCWHTDAVKELFTFVWNGNCSLRIGYSGLDGAGRNTRLIKTYSVEFLNDLKIPIISTFGGTDLNMELNNVFLRLLRKASKEQKGGQPKKLLDLVQKYAMKNKTNITIEKVTPPVFTTTIANMREDLSRYYSIPNLQIGYYKGVPISAKSYFDAEKIYKLIDILREIFAEGNIFIGMESKIATTLQFIYTMFDAVNLDSVDTKNVDLNNFNKVRKIVEEKNIQE